MLKNDYEELTTVHINNCIHSQFLQQKEEHADDAPAAEKSVNTEISVVVIYPDDIQSWALGVDNSIC